jgi:hypothetical protein
MGLNVQPVGGLQEPESVSFFANLSSNLYKVAEATLQVSIRVFFILANISIAAYVLPFTWHATLIPVITVGSTALTGFFYMKDRPVFGSFFASPQTPLLRPIIAEANGVLPADMPADAPRGFHREGNNCAFNATAQFLETSPELAAWLRDPIPDEIELEPFIDRIRQDYSEQLPEETFDAFRQYVNAQRRPLLFIPKLFDKFLNRPNAPFLPICDTFNALRILHKPYCDFYHQKDEAVQNRQLLSQGNSQNLRVALSQVNPLIKAASHVQTDADEALKSLFRAIPDRFKAKVRMTNEFLDPNRVATSYEVRESCFSLPIIKNNTPDGILTLEHLFQNYCNSTEVEPPLARAKVELLSAPPALYFHIKRFDIEQAPCSWLTKWLPSFFRPLPIKKVKVDPPIHFPPEFQVRLATGELKTYRLAGSVNHDGSTIDSGHYTAAINKGDQRYLMDDTSVTLVDQDHKELWDGRLQHAYLLSYVCVDPVAAN